GLGLRRRARGGPGLHGCCIRGAVAACARRALLRRRRRRRAGIGRGRGRGGGLLAAPPASEAAACRGRGQQGTALLQGQRLRVALLGDLGILLLVGDVGAVAPVQHLDTVLGEVLDEARGVRRLLGADHLARALERDGVRVVLLE